MVMPLAASADHQDISRLATELNLAAGQLAYGLRANGGYSNLRRRADHLSREAADLIDAVRRNRNESRVNSQFNEVSKRYSDLEQAFLRANRSRFSPYLANEFDRINGIYTNLNAEFYYQDNYVNPRSYSYTSRVQIVPEIDRRYESAVKNYYPPNQRGLANAGSWRQSLPEVRPDRRDYGRMQVLRMPQYDHRSPVLERQQLLDNRRSVWSRSQSRFGIESNRSNHLD